jgi:hypothetical protein
LASLETVLIIFPAKDMVLASFFFGDEAWYHSVLHYFLSGSTSHDVQQDVIISSSMLLKQMQSHIHACPFVLDCQQLGNLVTTYFPVPQSLYHHLHSIMSNAKLHHDFPVFHPLSHTADTHAGTSIDMNVYWPLNQLHSGFKIALPGNKWYTGSFRTF